MNILLDTNVILEYFAVREKYAIAKQLFEHLRGEGDVLFMSAGSFYTMVFLVDKMLRKQMGLQGESRVKALRDIMEQILNTIAVAEHDRESLLRGVRNMQFKDIEDGCQFELAKKASCEMLLTFNDSDYPTDTESGVTVLSPEEYLESCK
jgi:predicted nucleic acid-binding protein